MNKRTAKKIAAYAILAACWVLCPIATGIAFSAKRRG